MIPKTIHYCWFGGNPKSAKEIKCIDSWKKYCPDYKIIEWNEKNFNVYQNEYTTYCYDNKKWAFLSDYVRLLVIYNEGGIYFDTDVELLKNLDEFLTYDAFFGFEDDENINTGQGFGATQGNELVQEMINQYNKLKYNEHGQMPITKCPQLNTAGILPFGLKLDGSKQMIGNNIILPKDYMNPYDDSIGKLFKTKNTISIHWYSKTWMDKRIVLKSKLTKPLHRLQQFLGLRKF